MFRKSAASAVDSLWSSTWVAKSSWWIPSKLLTAGQPASHVPVQFSVTGSATLSLATNHTDRDGCAHVTVTAGGGGSNIVTISAGSNREFEQIMFQVPCELAPGSAVAVTVSVRGISSTVSVRLYQHKRRRQRHAGDRCARGAEPDRNLRDPLQGTQRRSHRQRCRPLIGRDSDRYQHDGEQQHRENSYQIITVVRSDAASG